MVIATGISSVTTQLLSIREFLAQFSGNEFVIALIIFVWLILGGLGTLVSHVFARYNKISLLGLTLCSFILVFASVAQLSAIRLCPDYFFLPGSSIGFYPTLAYILLTVGPYAILIGFVLPYSLYVIRNFQLQYPGAGIYLADNIGDVLGGALFSFVLVFWFTPFQSIFLANIPLLISLWFIIYSRYRRYFGLFALFSSLVLIAVPMILEKETIDHQHIGQLVHYQESRYGRIEVFENKDQMIVFNDGEPSYSTQNKRAAEYCVHFPLSQLSQVDSVCLISATSSIMSEISKYQPQRIDYVEMDPALTNVLFQYGFLERVSGLQTIHEDGRKYLQKSKSRYDSIIMSLSEPNTFKANRFYTYEFFSLVEKHLREKGVFCFSVQGYDNYPSEAQVRKLSSLYQTLKEVFPNILLLPLDKLYFLSSNQALDLNIPELLKKKGISTYYISRYFSGNVTKERIKSLKSLIDTESVLNSDTSPRLMQIMFQQWFEKYSASPIIFYVFLCLLGLLYMILIKKEEFVLFSTGWMNMGIELLVILTFQIFFGYVYLYVGLIVTVFLAGLCPGAWFGNQLQYFKSKYLIGTDLAIIALLGIFLTILIFFTNMAIAFLLSFGFLLSLICGFQFPVALELQGGGNNAVSRSFSADLIGAAAGALVTSVVLIPLLGLQWTLVVFIGIKFMSLACTIWRR